MISNVGLDYFLNLPVLFHVKPKPILPFTFLYFENAESYKLFQIVFNGFNALSEFGCDVVFTRYQAGVVAEQKNDVYHYLR